MKRLTENKVVLVERRTRVEELIARFNTIQQAQFYVEHLGGEFEDYLVEHRNYRAAIKGVERRLGELGRVHRIDRGFAPNFLFGPRDTVVTVGQDGLVANVLKYLDGQPLVAVNPDPARFEGVLLPFGVADVTPIVTELFAERRPTREITMARATLNTGEKIDADNDLFVGPRSHTSAHYEIAVGGRSERQSSSGIIVSTGLGSTGWLRSIFAGAAGIAESTGGKCDESAADVPFAWEARELRYSVREPWPSRTSAASIVFGRVVEGQSFTIESEMPEQGVIFSDGIESDFLAFNSGTRATIGISPRRGILVV
jgi:NAD kinase